jgi:predicted transcriptional regulator
MIFHKYQKITIVRSEKPMNHNVNDDLNWFGISIGLFNLRDKDKSCFRTFIELLKASKKNEELTSDEIAQRIGLTRGTVVHHLNNMMNAGIVLNDKNKYFLRVHNLKLLVDEIEKDIQRTCSDLKDIAKEIDDSIGIR